MKVIVICVSGDKATESGLFDYILTCRAHYWVAINHKAGDMCFICVVSNHALSFAA